MDPHSRFSHFNSRQTKAGPSTSNVRRMDPQMKPSSVRDDAKAGTRTPSTREKTPSSPSASALYSPRPIASNSRVRQDEQYRKDMYLAFVNNALHQKSQGIKEAFDELVDQFNPRKFTPDGTSPAPQLRLWILAISHVVSRLEREHSDLVDAIINLPWTTLDTGFVKSYTNFVGMLVSARPEYLSLVLGKVAAGLTHQAALHALNTGLPETSSSPLTRRMVYDRVHFLLRHILSLVPTMTSTLQPLLARNFPHKRQEQPAQVTYIRNLLRVTEYCPEIADKILAMIIDRAIQIDVEIQVELEELEERLDSEEHQEVFELDPFDTLVGQEGDDSADTAESDDEGDNLSDLSSDAGGEADDDEDQPDPETDLKYIQAMVNKLDVILKIIFDHFDNTRGGQPSLSAHPASVASLTDSSISIVPPDAMLTADPADAEATKSLQRMQFHTLLAIFDRTILRTFKSRYTQFIIFWYSSLDPEFCDLFQGMLISKALLEEDQPAVTRAAAASYIASFVSRAQFVDRDSARRVVVCLCNFLRVRLDMLEAVAQMGGAHHAAVSAQHGVLYAVTQAVFLIFCFRWRDLLEDQEEPDEFAPAHGPPKKWMPELDVIQRVVSSKLNPLKACSPNVVAQFAHVAHATGFVYCYSIMEANRRSEYAPPTPGAGPSPLNRIIQENSVTSELNSFFPFDPYKLPKSSSYIQDVYREWSSVAIDEEDDAESGEEDDEAEPMGIFVHGVRPNDLQPDGTEGLGESFGGMSISPVQAPRPPPGPGPHLS